MASFSSLRSDVFSREQRRQHYGSHLMGLNAYDRHKKFMQDYVNQYQKGETSGAPKLVKTDMDTLRENYRFIRTEEDDMDRTWEQRLAKSYYDKLFKEYCIADMSRYKESKIGLRWRSEKEVISGKAMVPPALTPGVVLRMGRKVSSYVEIKSAMKRMDYAAMRHVQLISGKVNFAYTESGESRQALVKLRVCPRCAYKLNYRKEKQLERQLLKEQGKQRKSRRERKSQKRRKESVESDNDTDSENGTSSGSPNSQASSEKRHVETGGEKQNAQEDMPQWSRDRPAGAGSIETPQLQSSKQSHGTEEFEPFFKDMFL